MKRWSRTVVTLAGLASLSIGSAFASEVTVSNGRGKTVVIDSGGDGAVNIETSTGKSVKVRSGGAATQVEVKRPAAPPPPPSDAPPPPPRAVGAPAPAGRALKVMKLPVVCTGNNAVVIDNARLEVAGAAITSSGNCNVTVRGSVISGDTAVVASGNSHLNVVNSTIQGQTASFNLSGNSNAMVAGSAVKGAVQRSGNASVTEGEGNSWE